MTDSFAFLANCPPGQLIRSTRKQNEAGVDFKQKEFQTRPNLEPSEFKELSPKGVSGKAERPRALKSIIKSADAESGSLPK